MVRHAVEVAMVARLNHRGVVMVRLGEEDTVRVVDLVMDLEAAIAVDHHLRVGTAVAEVECLQLA
jgi:hypothetical protein